MAVIGTLLLVVTTPFGEGVRTELCKLFGGSGCGSPPKTDQDYKPKACERSSTEKRYGAVIKVAIVKLGDEYSFMRQEMADGSVRLTVIPTNVELGLETGVGGKLSLGKNLKLGADIMVGGGIKVGVGDTYVFKNADEANRFEDDIKEISYRDAAKDIVAGGNPLTGWVADRVDDWTGRPDIKDPEITNTTVSARVAVDGIFGLYLPQVGSKGDGSDDWDFNLNTGVTVRGEVGEEFAVTENRMDPKNPTTSYFMGLSGTIGGSAEVLGAGAEGDLKWTGGQRFVFDKDGKLTAVIYQTSFEKGGKVNGRLGGNYDDKMGTGKGSSGERTVETVTQILPVDDTNRELVRNHLLNHPYQMPSNLLRYMGGDDNVLQQDPGPNADPFDRLMYQNATVLKQQHANSTDGFEVGAEAKLGLVLGAEIKSESSKNATTRAEYLGAPRNGRREYVPYTECVD
ncbi:hypothetical protein ACSNOI_25565 [Actinomadura kijaniata]|uniref:hypothetical protein n=1 Tax=Actinomadura kijaniata TaxID=46161 RepID=UPI003F1B1C29